MKGKLVSEIKSSNATGWYRRTIKRVKCPGRGTFPQKAEIVRFQGINEFCRLGGVAIHQSSSIKIKLISNYSKFKINGSLSDYGADKKVVIIPVVTASAILHCQQNYIKLCRPFSKKFTPNPVANEMLSMCFPLLDMLCSFISHN